MNILNITKSLHERINSATSLDEILILTKTIERLNLGTVKTVANYSDLLLEYPREGEVYFVENEEQLYYGFNGLWYLISRTATTIAYGWGINQYGSLGDGTTSSRSSPVTVLGGFTDWSAVSSSRYGGAGIRADGTLWSWGYSSNSVPMLGDNTIVPKSSPVSVVGGFTDWVSVSRGQFFSSALRSSGQIWCWGQNTNGQLGDDTTTARRSPVSLIGGISDWTKHSSGFSHSLALRSNGTLWAWGNGLSGQLGNNASSNRSSPVSVVGGFTDWVSVDGGNIYTLAVRANGTAWAWGNGGNGRLGDNTTSNRSSPVSVVGGFTDWIFLSAGERHSLGLRSNGTIWSWGYNTSGQLGDNTTVTKSSPVSVVGGFTDWTSINAADAHNVALRANGTLWSWGANSFGQLGDNTTSNRSSPVSVVGGFTDWVVVSATQLNVLAIRSTT